MKLALLKRLFALALVGAAFMATAAHAEDLLDQVKARGTLRIALEGTYAPFDYRAPDGQLIGYDVDIAKAIVAKLGIKPDFIPTEWSGIIAGLQAGKFDVIISQVNVTEQRKTVFDFSRPYTYSAAQLIQRKNDKRQFNSLEDLKGKKLGVGLGTTFMQMAKAVPGVNVMTYPDTPAYIQDLVSGRIDAAMTDRLTMVYLLKKTPMPVRTSGIVGGNLPSAIPFKKGNPKFAKALDDAMAQLQADGTFTKISEKWFGIDVSQPIKQ
ncbi:MAG: transporter substrate-binding domain-containing protein [Burkholderiaceae bacterium]|jgi:cystine transport system substrate-binding protein|nr:transporter substrate-binding domain-containing protein [Burkholderiaceae bacterium]